MTTGLSRAGFDLDLAAGQLREGQLAQLLGASGQLVEVKTDYQAWRTGNIFVEYAQRGFPVSLGRRPSGLAITVATWWAEILMGPNGEDILAVIILPTTRMKELARRAREQRGPCTGGDGNLYDGVLIPVAWLTP